MDLARQLLHSNAIIPDHRISDIEVKFGAAVLHAFIDECEWHKHASKRDLRAGLKPAGRRGLNGLKLRLAQPPVDLRRC